MSSWFACSNIVVVIVVVAATAATVIILKREMMKMMAMSAAGFCLSIKQHLHKCRRLCRSSHGWMIGPGKTAQCVTFSLKRIIIFSTKRDYFRFFVFFLVLFLAKSGTTDCLALPCNHFPFFFFVFDYVMIMMLSL